jgi:hypothetical protein
LKHSSYYYNINDIMISDKSSKKDTSMLSKPIPKENPAPTPPPSIVPPNDNPVRDEPPGEESPKEKPIIQDPPAENPTPGDIKEV